MYKSIHTGHEHITPLPFDCSLYTVLTMGYKVTNSQSNSESPVRVGDIPEFVQIGLNVTVKLVSMYLNSRGFLVLQDYCTWTLVRTLARLHVQTLKGHFCVGKQWRLYQSSLLPLRSKTASSVHLAAGCRAACQHTDGRFLMLFHVGRFSLS